MLFRSSKTQPSGRETEISRARALDCVPVRNPQITEQKNDNGEVCLAYQVRVRPWFQNIVRKISGRPDAVIERKLQLDSLGTVVWQMINGQRRVREIIKDFQAMHKLNSREAEISVTAFLKDLGRRGLVVMRDGEL